MPLELGPLVPLREDALVWLGPSVPLQTIVAVDLTALAGADAALRAIADRLVGAGEIPDAGMSGDLTTATGELGQVDNILFAEAFDHMANGVSAFDHELDGRSGELPGEGAAPFRLEFEYPGDTFDTE